MNTFRKTSQDLAPAHRPAPPTDQYDVYPAFPLGSGKIQLGYVALAQHLSAQRQVIIDGYGGVLWERFRAQLDQALIRLGKRAAWINARDALYPDDHINRLIAPFLGGDDPIFGTRFTGSLRDFFQPNKLRMLQPNAAADLSIIYGCGAALAGWDGLLIYVDVPKNEIQFRAWAGSICNLGASLPADPKAMYKRFYFVDWIALNQHKAALLPRLDLIVDEQRPDEPTLMRGADLRDGLTAMSRNYCRARPWFEPGPWGGQWIKQHIAQLPQHAPNYAWSFELITPENGLMFESDNRLLEVSFDLLMYHDHRAVLGEAADRFGYEFPIRFDFLDTFDGSNLSVQCHPSPAYIRQHFGENFTQDETYYILDCAPDAQVYLGFHAGVDPTEFRTALERSFTEAQPVDVARFVHVEPAHKHDLFLIPHGTIHASGKNNLVLEISATPYIFTFKMYDWLRLDLDGRPRPLNISRAFDNLNFARQGEQAKRELIAQPVVIDSGDDWQLIHLPTHSDHFYDVHRFDFACRVDVNTDGACHILSLVEGQAITLETANGCRQRFAYAETFVVPAAAQHYRLINEGAAPVKVIKAFVR
ncbi:MAG: class I mannose-6-phosphate isomerase [Anaerolineae bacterium]|nr:class I mannose-6-phosphate isomerase [Anaerolineae bacterium]